MGVDILRFIAAFMVAVFHLGYWSWVPEVSGPASVLLGRAQYPSLTEFSWWGWVGVEIFFVVSGFLISYSASKSTPKRFLQGRFLRLFPGALICATLTLIAAIAIDWKPSDTLIGMYLRSIAFWPFGPWIDGVYWTLAIELSFYALVYTLLLVRRFSWLENIMIAIGVASSASWVFWFLVVSPAGSPYIPGLPVRVAELMLVQHGMYFAIGTLLWIGIFHGWSTKRLMALSLLIAAGILPILSEVLRKTQADTTIVYTITPIAIWLFAVLLLWASAHFRDKMEAAFSPRVARLVSTVGLATYPLYLLHDVIGAAMMRVLIDGGVGAYVALSSALLLMVALAVFVTIGPEERLRVWFQGGRGQKRPPSAQSAG